MLGSSIVQFAIIWYVTLETSSGGWVALLSAAAYIPQFLISFFALTMVQTASTTLLQENSTPEMAGRIFGLYGAVYSSFLPIGMVVFGMLADRTSMRLLMVVSGCLLIIMATIMFVDKSFYRHSSDK